MDGLESFRKWMNNHLNTRKNVKVQGKELKARLRTIYRTDSFRFHLFSIIWHCEHQFITIQQYHTYLIGDIGCIGKISAILAPPVPILMGLYHIRYLKIRFYIREYINIGWYLKLMHIPTCEWICTAIKFIYNDVRSLCMFVYAGTNLFMYVYHCICI